MVRGLELRRLRSLAPLLLLLAAGCVPPSGAAGDAGAPALPDAGVAAECAATDGDGDGYGTAPTCAARDCDDANLSIHPGAPEACNGLDDDCDGPADEDLGSGYCGVGVCRREVPNCQDGHPVACTPGEGGPEVCNGLDDDCDGVADDGALGLSCGEGACARTSPCEGGVQSACVPGEPAPEQCNRVDDDCDGVVDDGFRVTAVDGRYSSLRGYHAGCDGAGQRMGTDCNAAFTRYCAQAGCSNAGFGPLENSGDIAIFACVAADPARDVPWTTLAAQHPGCDGSTERMGPNCNAAMHRYCVSLGYATGFGPGELGPGSALVTCLAADAVAVEFTGYSTLVTHHDGCGGQTWDARWGPACNAAIHRYCAARGYLTGFGPLENSGDFAAVACVSP